ncbi:MAG: endonuclease/exonuclease/phosphatase family protein [Acidobacterium ailaaui]|nr:endonuclease/exonuclease/phosphatase family protein [Pseudacidobacterium ailaaui]
MNSGVIGDTSGLRVMTYNIHHGNPPSKAAEGTIDLRAIANVINKAKPDLVALQEVDVNTTRSGIDVNEAEALAKLTGMHFHFSQALNYQGGKYGDAVLSRFPIADTFSYQLPIIKGTNEEIRVLSMIKVKLPGNKVILFGSTHLGLSEDTRILQAKSLVKIVQFRPWGGLWDSIHLLT